MDTKERFCFSEPVMIALVSNGFWLALLIFSLVFFRAEIRNALNSLSSVNIAGSHLELADRQMALKSSAILSNIFLDMLCTSESKHLTPLLSESEAQQLNKFTIKYVEEVPKEELNLLLVSNIAWIGFRKGTLADSFSIYKSLVCKYPRHPSIHADYGYALLDTNPGEAKNIYDELVKQYPGEPSYRYCRAVAYIKTEPPEFDKAVADWTNCLDAGYMDDQMLDDIKPLSINKPSEYSRLKEKYEKFKSERQQK
ncbi:MAG TPA: hypothetical protein VMC85_22650 [Desulfomonilaceae bacterium]|nr:hypothetical protein [Desulfomonilaceae bacterium]